MKASRSGVSHKTGEFSQLKIASENFLKIRQEPVYSQYQMLNKIGEGAFGSVLKAKCLKTGDLRAIKIIKKKSMKESDHRMLMS